MNINDPQQSIDGWELIEPIGYGGNAKVWKARRPGTELVALKILNATNPTGEPYQRFVAEVTVGQGEANNPGVLPLIDYSLPDAPNKHMRAWLAMPIAERIDHAFADYRSLEKVVEAISSIAATLAELAERDIYHRDIKPQNLYRYEGRWVIGDFGLVDYPDKQSLTVSDKPVGSRYFIAPEMTSNPKTAMGGPVDVYSLAKTLWVLALGQNFPPPGQQRREERLATLVGNGIQHFRAFLLDRLIERATALEPKARPTMREVAGELRAWLTPATVPDAPIDLASVGTELTQVMEASQRREEQKRERLRETIEITARLDRSLRLLADNLQTSGLPISIGSNKKVLNHATHRLHTWEEEYHGGVCLVIESKGRHAVTLWSGFGVILHLNGLVLVSAAHFLKQDPWEDELPWHDQRQMQIGTAQQDVMLNEIIQGLNDSFRAALIRFAELRLQSDKLDQ